MAISIRKQRKRGGYPVRPHRRGPGTFIIHYLAWKHRWRHKPTRMYDSIEDCMVAEAVNRRRTGA